MDIWIDPSAEPFAPTVRMDRTKSFAISTPKRPRASRFVLDASGAMGYGIIVQIIKSNKRKTKRLHQQQIEARIDIWWRTDVTERFGFSNRRPAATARFIDLQD
jgi:hypothetical protein